MHDHVHGVEQPFVGSEEHSDSGRASDDESDDETFTSDQSTLAALPTRLKLPLELELYVLDLYTEPWDDLWLNQRLVSKAWCKHIESRARNKWIRRAYLHFANGLDYGLKLVMTARWTFQRIEDDGTVVFQDTDCDETYKKRIARECKRTGPDIVLGHYVFDIEIPGMTFDWPNMIARVHWRALVARIFAEEAAVKSAFQRGKSEMYRRAAAVMQGSAAGVGGVPNFDFMQDIFTAFADNLEDGYRAVYRERHGRDDPHECERLQDLRFEIGYDPIDSDDDREEARRKKAGEKSVKEQAMFLRARYRMNPELLRQ